MITRSVEETLAWAESLAQRLGPGDVVCLSGELGAGKSVIARGVGRGLGVTDEIVSPTFNYVLEYAGRVPFFHADLYRLQGIQDFVALGLEEYFERDGVFVIEWPERVTDLLPGNFYRIHVVILPNMSERQILLTEPRR